jgi:hypothetical protein
MLFNDQHCHKHGVTGHFNGKCSRCSGEQADLERRQHFGRLDAMTVEERLRAKTRRGTLVNTNHK